MPAARTAPRVVSAATARLLEKARAAFKGGPGLLEVIGWPRSVERAFFARGAEQLPQPRYEVERDRAEEKLARLDALEAELRGDDALSRLLRARAHSHRLGQRMLLAVGTPELSRLSVEAFGSARTGWLDGDTTNLHFAEHILARIGSPQASEVDEEEAGGDLDAAGLVTYIEERLARRRLRPELTIEVDDDLSAKAIAGKTRVRIRADATFEPEEARSLYLHEIETHVFTAQNGDAQPHLDFLDSGGPLATRTQEGLAVFAELYSHALTLGRLRRLADRVRLVAMAEGGASFLDLYRDRIDAGVAPRTAYLDVARIFRGGTCDGGAPFTKDASYLAGLVEVYNFLRVAIGPERRHVADVLVSGRLALAEVAPLVSLADDGLLAPPTFRPGWLRRWDDLVAHFTFSSFLDAVALDFAADQHRWVGDLDPRRRGVKRSPA